MKNLILCSLFLTLLNLSLHANDCNKQSIPNAFLVEFSNTIKTNFDSKYSMVQENSIIRRVDKKALVISGICGWVTLNLCLKSRFHLKNALFCTGISIIFPYAMLKQKNKY